MDWKVVLSLFALVAVVFAGCIDAGEQVDGDPVDDVGAVAADWWVDSVPSSETVDGHDHSLHAHHENLTTPNFEVLGWDPLVTDQHGETVPGMMCGGVTDREDGRRIAIVHSISNDMAFMAADVTDPENPFMVGEFYMPNGITWDADISADGMHVLAGAYPVGVFGDPTLPDPPMDDPSVLPGLDLWKPEIYFRDACTGAVQDVGPENYVPYGPGIVLISIADPEEPVYQDWRSQPAVGPHSVGSHFVGDDVIATASVTNLAHEASYYSFFRITETPAGSVLEPYSQIRVPGVVTPTESDLGGVSPWLNGHVDVWIHEHPVTGQVLAYLANWDQMYVYDISIPQAPLEIASWFDGEHRSIHTTYPFPELVDDKQYLIVGQEVSERQDRPTGWIFIVDVTDPTDPQEVSRWTLPVKPRWDGGGLQFSTHYARVLEDMMFVSVNHAGLWAVNISDIEKPRSQGVFVGDRPSPSPLGGGDHAPHIGDVGVDLETGVITTWDGPAGVYQLRFNESMPAPFAPDWVVE